MVLVLTCPSRFATTFAVKLPSDGAIMDEHFLPILYELDRRDEWTDPAAWEKANPSLGEVKKLDDLRIKVDRAKANPNELSGVLCKEFNIRETAGGAWLSYDAINNTDVFSIEEFLDAYCIGGVDLSITIDLTCASLLFMKTAMRSKRWNRFARPCGHTSAICPAGSITPPTPNRCRKKCCSRSTGGMTSQPRM